MHTYMMGTFERPFSILQSGCKTIPAFAYSQNATSIGKTWNACIFEIERPAGEERNRIRGAQRRGFFALRPQGARIPRLTCLENGKPLA